MKKSNLKTICYVLIFTAIVAACSNSQNNQHNQNNQQKDSPNLCENIKTTVQNEIGGKISMDSTIVFFPAKDNNEAFKQAQILAIKMGVEPPTKKNDTLYYAFPEENASIQIVEKKEDKCLFIILYLSINCEGYPVKEICYICNKCYNEL